MTWPSRIYVATQSLGVFYTNNFTDPAVQPTWTTVNTGLGALDCREFALDPHDNAGRQYVLLEASRELYMREGGAWATILTAADADTLTSRTGQLIGFCADHSVAGRLWVTYGVPGGIAYTYLYAFFTDNYGTDWTAQQLYYSMFGYGYQYGHPRSNGDNVWIPSATGAGGALAGMRYTSNKGAAWAVVDLGANNTIYDVCLNPLLPDLAYVSANAIDYNLLSLTNLGGQTGLQDDIGPRDYDVMWFDEDDVDHQRILRVKLHSTDDAWATESVGGDIDESPNQIAPYAGTDPDNIFVDLDINHGAQEHALGTLYGEADTTPTGIAGSNPDSAPYTDSIPYGCGGVAVNGIGCLEVVGHVYTYAVSFE